MNSDVQLRREREEGEEKGGLGVTLSRWFALGRRAREDSSGGRRKRKGGRAEGERARLDGGREGSAKTVPAACRARTGEEYERQEEGDELCRVPLR